MRGRDLVMWPEGQWEASKKTALEGANRHTDGHGDSMFTNSAQWGRVGEKEDWHWTVFLKKSKTTAPQLTMTTAPPFSMTTAPQFYMTTTPQFSMATM